MLKLNASIMKMWQQIIFSVFHCVWLRFIQQVLFSVKNCKPCWMWQRWNAFMQIFQSVFSSIDRSKLTQIRCYSKQQKLIYSNKRKTIHNDYHNPSNKNSIEVKLDIKNEHHVWFPPHPSGGMFRSTNGRQNGNGNKKKNKVFGIKEVAKKFIAKIWLNGCRIKNNALKKQQQQSRSALLHYCSLWKSYCGNSCFCWMLLFAQLK